MNVLPSGLHYRHWQLGERAKAVVLLVHGLGEHSGRYDILAQKLNAHDIAVVAPDHLGHGLSPGTRVFVRGFDDFLIGVRECRALIQEVYPHLPCFLLGHSMGGLISVRLLESDQTQYAGVMLSGPALAITEPLPAPVLWVGRLLARIAPRMGMLALDPNGVSRDPDVVSRYQSDPLVHHGKVTAGLGIALIDAMARVPQGAPALTLPTLIMHGGADKLAAPAGSEQFFELLGAADKTLKLLPGLYHEIFNEPEGEAVAAEFIDWLEARL